MKRILTSHTTPEPTIFAKNLPDHPIIGTCSRKDLQTKGFIQRHEFADPDSYQITLFDGATRGMRYHNVFYGGTLSQTLSSPHLDYFLFDTEKELFEWLLK